jgi:mRNA-degrading endonuclease toxin of MazEF toxin-antitoxin module
VRRGEVWWYEPPDEKPRSVLILTSDEDINRQFDVIAAPATSTVRNWDTEVELGPQDGMPVECVLSVGNTFLAQKVFLTKQITQLSPERMSEVCRALAHATSC